MSHPFQMRIGYLIRIVILAWMTGCQTPSATSLPSTAASVGNEAPQHSGVLTDFSGHWEKNYQASDDFNTRFQLYLADIQRSFNQRNVETAGFAPALGVDAESINGLARFAEEITRMPLLNITQEEGAIDIARDNDFNLRCSYGDRLYVQSGNAFGNEVCGWNSERLLFNMRLGDGLSISHQFSLSADGSQLNVTTTVSSARVTVPVVISNYYTRYNKPDDNYNCQQTLTRQRVCSQRGLQ
jgi:hypothetical protein